MKKLFIVITASLLVVTDANATPMRNANKGHFSSIVVNNWHGVVNQRYLDRMDGCWNRALKGVVRNDKAVLNEIFRTDIGDVYTIVLRQLTWLNNQDPDVGGLNKNLISVEDAFDLIDRLQVVTVTNYWDGGAWVSTRYATGGTPDYSTWLKNIPSDKILALDGDINNPGFRLRCLNPIVAGPNYTANNEPEPKQKEKQKQQEQEKAVSVVVTVEGNNNTEPQERVVYVERRRAPMYRQNFPPQRMYRPPQMGRNPFMRRMPMMQRQPMIKNIIVNRNGGYYPRGDGYHPQPQPQLPPQPRRYNTSRPGRHQ